MRRSRASLPSRAIDASFFSHDSRSPARPWRTDDARATPSTPRARSPPPRARDRSIRRGFVARIRIRTPDARANATSTRATRGRIPHTHTHTHTHHRRATSPFASERPATRDARVDVSRPIARHPPASALVASPRIHTWVSSRFLYDHGTHIPPADYPYHPDTPPPAWPHEGHIHRSRLLERHPHRHPLARSLVLHRGKSKKSIRRPRSIHHRARSRVHRPPRLRLARLARAGGEKSET